MTSITQAIHIGEMRRRFNVDVKHIARKCRTNWQTVILWEEGAIIPTADELSAYQAAVIDAVSGSTPNSNQETYRKPKPQETWRILQIMHKLGVTGRDIAAVLGIPSRAVHNKLYGNYKLSCTEYEAIMLFLKHHKLGLIFGKGQAKS